MTGQEEKDIEQILSELQKMERNTLKKHDLKSNSYGQSDVMICRAKRAIEKTRKWVIDHAVPILTALIALALFALIMMFGWMIQ